MRDKMLGIIAAIFALIVVLGWGIYQSQGVDSDYTDEIQYIIGVSQTNMREEWRVALIQEIQKEAKQYEHIKIITTDATDMVEKQQKDIDRLIQYGIDLLIISPCDTAGMTQKVREVYQSGIPVIVMDRSVEGFDYNLFIGPDNMLIGKYAGECVLELLPDQSGNILELRAKAASAQSQERSEGFESVVGEYQRIDREKCLLSRELKDQAYDAVVELGKDMNRVDVIFASNDYVALGAYEALTDLGMEKDIMIVGSDGYAGENEGVDLVKQGKLAATISCPTGGREAIQYAMMILKKESGVPKQVILRSHIITRENADEYLATLNQEWEDNGERIRVGYSQIGQESAWRLANTKSIVEAAEEFNVELLFDDANQSQERQIAAMRRFIEEKVDVIVLSPVVESGWDEVMAEANAAGIPVVMSDRKINTQEELATAYIGADFLEEGRRAMRWVRDNVAPGTDQKKIMELQGTEKAAPTLERKAGFEEILVQCPEYQIVHTEHGDFTIEGGKEIVENYLQNHEWDIDIIYSHNDDMALGAIEALEAHGLNPGEDVKIISVDGTKEALQALSEGKLNCAVECNPLLGQPLMKAIRDLVAGKEMPLKIITEEKVFDQEISEEEKRMRTY